MRDDLYHTTFLVHRGVMNKVPRDINISKILRWFLKLLTSSHMEWIKLVREDGEIKEVQDFIRPYMRRALGLSKIKDLDVKLTDVKLK